MMAGMKWLFFLFPFFLFATPQEELLKIFDIPSSEIVETTKQLWMQQGKERWQFEQRYEYLRPQVWPLFEEMGMLSEIKPAREHYDAVLVLGSLLSTFQARVQYLEGQQIHFDKIVFLTGARPLLNSEKERLPGLETETEMVQWVYEHSDLPKEVPVLFIDTPMQGTKRPTTVDTVIGWLQTSPSVGDYLAISNQPYVHYQNAVLNRIVPFAVETVGPAPRGDPSVDLMLDTLAKQWLYESEED